MTRLLLGAIGALFAAQPALAGQAYTMPAADEVSIPFAGHGGIADWERESDKSILLRDRTGRWYRATFLGTCPRVGYGNAIQFDTDAGGTFDRFSTIRSINGVCQVGSVTRASAPASKGGR